MPPLLKLTTNEQVRAVLGGKADLDLPAMFDLVHQVNPTGDAVPENERRVRYALKHQLQSLIILRFPDELMVLSADADSSVVSLRHVSTAADACHAVVEDLDEDARSWVRFQIDTAAAATPTDATPVPSRRTKDAPHRARVGTAESWLGRGKAALADFDYELAKEAYQNAVVESAGSVGTTIVLFELLVDTLADFDAALILADQLPAATRTHPTVAALFAVAAASAGNVALARQLLRDLQCGRAAEAWVLVARAALAAQNFVALAGALAAARDCGPVTTAGLELEAMLQARRLAERAPLELELQRLLVAGDVARVETMARDLLQRWPDCALARKTLQDITDRQAKAASASKTSGAQHLLTAGNPAAAVALLRTVPDQARTADHERLLAQAVVALKATNLRRAIADIVADVRGGRSTQAYLAWCLTDEDTRAGVAAEAPDPAWSWLRQLKAGGTRDRPAVAAAIVLGVLVAGDITDPEQVLAQFQTHPGLALLADARAMRDRALQQQQEALGRDIAQLRHRFASNLAAQDVASCRAALSVLERVLGREDADYGAMAASLGRLERRIGQLATVQSLSSQGDWLELHHALLGLAARFPEDPEASQWGMDAASARAQAAAKWPVRDEILSEPATPILPVSVYGGERHKVVPDLGIVVPIVLGNTIFVECIDPENGTVHRRSLLRGPVSDAESIVAVHGGMLFVMGSGQVLHELSLAPLAMVRARKLQARPGEVVEGLPLANKDYLWCTTSDRPSLAERLRIFDRATLRKLREFPDIGLLACTITALEPPGIFVAASDGGAKILTPAGRLHPSARVHDGMLAEYVDISPIDRRHVVALCRQEDSDEADFELWAQLGDGTGFGYVLKGTNCTRTADLATATDIATVFVLAALKDPSDSPAQLMAFQLDGGKWQSRYAVNAPHDARLVPSVDGAVVWLHATGPDQSMVVQLTTDPPVFDVKSEATGALPDCSLGSVPARPEVALGHRELAQVWRNMLVPHAQELIRDQWLARNSATDRLEMLQLLVQHGGGAMADYLLGHCISAETTTPRFEAFAAERLVAHGDYAGAGRALGDCDDVNWPISLRCHRLHVLMLAALVQGDLERARALHREALEFVEHLPDLKLSCDCRTSSWLEVADAAERAASGPPGKTRIDRELATIHAADAAMARGDHLAAINLLRPLAVKACGAAPQIVARYAHAWLTVTKRPDQWFDAALAAGSLLGAAAERHVLSPYLVPGQQWSRKRIDAVCEESERWLAACVSDLPDQS